MLDLFGNDVLIRWRKKPYPHVVMDRVFRRDFYDKMCSEFDQRLARGLVSDFARSHFWKFGHYDAHCYSIEPEPDPVFADVFYSLEWRRFVNGFFNLKLTPHVLAELHHHKAGSEAGYIHNDYDVSSFASQPLPNGLNPHRHQVKYRGRADGATHCVRSIAILYYFNNPEWGPANGGQTGMFADWEPGSDPVRKVAPVNNRLFAFEVSPKSFHAFLSNGKGTRNSAVMWYHSSEPYMVERYGELAK